MSSEPEFEGPQDGAISRLLPRPCEGGFSRGNFVRMASASRSLADAYDLAGKLGTGAMGTVVAGTHRGTGEPVAVKRVSKASVTNPAELWHEVDFLRVADHPHIVRLFECFEDEEDVFFVMEHCSGGELWKRILSTHEAGLGFSEAELAELLRQMLTAVAFCHSHSIVHRDLKPQNFLYTSDAPGAALKLVDFGVCGVVQALDPLGRFLTKTVGSDGYIAPEILLSRPYGPSVDLFSLGAVAHAVLTGLPPQWRGDHYFFPGKMRRRLLSGEAQGLLERLVDADPDARPTAAEALADPWFRTASSQAEPTSLLSPAILARMKRYGELGKLQRCLMGGLVSLARLEGPEVKSLQRVFMALDRDGSGEVSKEELSAAVAACCAANGLSDGLDVQDLVMRLDSSRDGLVSHSEWLAATASLAFLSQRGAARRAFDAIDHDADGSVTVAELRAALPGVFGVEELEDEIAPFDSDGDGVLSFEEFCQLIVHGS